MKRLLLLLLASCGHYQVEDTGPALVSIQIQDRNGTTETISQRDRLDTYQNIDFLASHPYKKVLRVFKQGNKLAGKITTYHPNGLPWQYLEALDMRAFGTFKEWHANGQLKVEATVIGGTADVAPGSQRDWLFDGLAQIWDEQGQIVAHIPYVKGVVEGRSLQYFTTGQIERDSPYLQNELEGEVVEYFAGGHVRSKTIFRRGIKQGPSVGYSPEGQQLWSEQYQDGLLLDAKYYSANGNLLSEVHGGSGYQAVLSNNVLDRMIEFRRGRPEGLVQTYFPDGNLKSLFHIKNGQKQGEEVEYYSTREREDGGEQQLLAKISIPWESDAIVGIVKTWYNNGKLQSQREIARNKKSGSSIGWYRDGALMYMEEYEEDKLSQGRYFKKGSRDPISNISNGNGLVTLYDEQGVFLRKIQYLKGKPVDPEN